MSYKIESEIISTEFINKTNVVQVITVVADCNKQLRLIDLT